MSYARARLWLGISGVGFAVTLAVTALLLGLPARFLSPSQAWTLADPLGLLAFVGCAVILLLPFDLLGGYVLPRHFGRPTPGLGPFAASWLAGVSLQSLLFLAAGLAILAGSRAAGLAGALLVVAAAIIAYVAGQGILMRVLVRGGGKDRGSQLAAINRRLENWGLHPLPTLIVDSDDPGFTGGVVGLPGLERIVLPDRWFDVLTDEELAVAVARRVEAVRSGSRTGGILLASGWILVGLFLASLLPGAGTASVAELVTTCCGFTCWAFLGLLVLPTISRQASFRVDQQVLQRGIHATALDGMISTLDRLQDDEPQRPALVETIFHPVPSVERRRSPALSYRQLPTWHAARMMLFLSWSCLGLLSRAVHCNAGRPELWTMLPTD